MTFRKKQKIVKKIGLIITIIGVLLICSLGAFIIICGINDIKIDIESIEKKIIPITAIVLVIILLLIFTLGPLLRNRYLNNIKKEYEKRRFRYLDTFYYGKRKNNSDVSSFVYTFYHIFEDCVSKKIYAIYSKNSNSSISVYFKGGIIVYRGKGLKSSWQTVDYLDEGNFWIKEELPDFYKRDNEDIILNFDEKFCCNKEKKASKKPIIYNGNSKYDITLLDKATFIDGYMEFDIK